eukprot:1427862-Prymnesium_polylepis.1
MEALSLTVGRCTPRAARQAGVHSAASIWGGSFDDDPGGLALKHDKPGLLRRDSGAAAPPPTGRAHPFATRPARTRPPRASEPTCTRATHL